jgi:quercetin dioxygenase-like cupin family protein
MTEQVEVRNFELADEVRTPEKTKIDLVKLGEHTLGRFTFQPGWRWADDIKPVVKTESCQNHHLGYALGGSLRVLLDNGQESRIQAGDAYDIPPGHDAWVEGTEPFVGLEFQSAAEYARPREVAR